MNKLLTPSNQNTTSHDLIIPWAWMSKAIIAALLLVPSNMYKLPVSLPFDLEIYRVVIIIALALWGCALLVAPEVRFRSTPIDLAIAFLMLTVFVSLLVNMSSYEPGDEFSGALKALIFFSSFFMVYYFFTSTIKTKDETEKFMRYIVLLAACVAFFGIIERFTGYNIFRHLHEWIPILRAQNVQVMIRGGIRIAGSVVHPIAFSAILAMVAPLAFHCWQTVDTRNKKLLYGCSTMLIIIALVLTGSRTGFLGLMGAALILFLGFPAQRRFIITALPVIAFVVHMIAPGALGTIRTMLSPDFISQREIGNNDGRLEDYPRIWAEFSEQPALGLGYYAFRPEKYFFVDNQYLKFLVEIGLIGVVAVFGVFASILWRLWRVGRYLEGSEKSLLLSVCASSLAFLIASATFDTFGFSQVPYLFFIIAALGIAFTLNIENKFELMPAIVSTRKNHG